MASSSTEQRPLHTHEILGRTAAWHFREGRYNTRDFDRACVVNSAIPFRCDGADLSFCILISAGASHLAAVEGCPAEGILKVTVFRLKDGWQEKWTSTHNVGGEQPGNRGVRLYESTSISGGITEDGESVLIVYRPAGRPTVAFTVTKDEFTPRQPPSDTANAYSVYSGAVSDDSEHIFYTRSGSPFGSGGQAKAVEAFSLRNLARLKAVTFSFGDGHLMRNARLLQPLSLQGPVYMAVDTSEFRDEEEYGRGTMLIASSDGKLHWHAVGLSSITGVGSKANATISPDGKHMFFVQKDDAILEHWDLRRPTLQPLGSAPLPGVEYSQSRRWIIHGQETTMRDAVSEKIDRIRCSPACSVVTVVTASASATIVNSFLAFNLQLVYHQKIQHTTWPGLVPLYIGFNDSTGLTIFSMSPTLTFTHPDGGSAVVGALGVTLPLEDVFEKLRKVEDYFDSTSAKVASMAMSIEVGGLNPVCRYSWRPGVYDRNDAAALTHELGRTPRTTAEDARRQQEFYDAVFANPSSSVAINSTPEIRHFVMPHLFSFNYPWDPNKNVSVFGIMMKNQYHVIAIGPSPSAPGKGLDVIRALYANDIKTGREIKERIEIYQSGNNYILHVCEEEGYNSGYSGIPMPSQRCTIISPHFLEEDAWYDLYIAHQAANVTMPTGWISTPNPALMHTVNMYAYFKPYTFAVMDVLDYGHRASAVYVGPKYLLWKEYGLRGLRKSRTNDIFFGGGRYADSLGHYYQSIYDDRTFDDSSPLFPSALALTCNIAHRSRATDRVDAFFRRLHQDNKLLLANTQSVSYSLPLACKARPAACLSLMRHIVLFPFKINDIGIVETRNGASRKHIEKVNKDGKWEQIIRFAKDVWHMAVPYHTTEVSAEPNTSRVTLPLQGFCTFDRKLYKTPPVATGTFYDDAFFEFARATAPEGKEPLMRWEQQVLNWVAHSSRGQASPFTRLIEEILEMKHRDTQLSFLRVPWLEKLLAWKLKTFSLYIYLTRTVLPILILFVLHLTVGVLSTEIEDERNEAAKVVVIVLGCIEALVSGYILYIKIRQIYRVPNLFFRSLPNYVDLIALSLGFTLFIMVVSGSRPPRAFLGFSTLLIWIAAILMLRIYRPVGMLLLLLTETIQEIFSYLALLSFIIVGFAFVPFLLLRNSDVAGSATPNPFSSFPLTISQMLNFIASNYDALEPFESESAAVRTLKALYIIVITILFLNTLIAILNLKIKRADKNAANLYLLQTASLQVEIELGLLSSSERERRDWFPEWFTYTITETERRDWNEFLDKNPLKWTEENNFGDDKDMAPKPLIPVEENTVSRPVNTSTTKTVDAATTAPSPSSKQAATTSKPSSGSAVSSSTHPDNSTATPLKQPSTSAQNPLIIHDNKPSSDLLDALGPIDESQMPPPDGDTDHSINWEDDDLWGSWSTKTKTKKKGTSHTVTSRNNAQLPSKPAEVFELSDNTCAICGAPGNNCLGCRAIAYCGTEHQKADWNRHKKECKKLGKAKATT